nr:SPASM domain-containing protein [Carnobacterium maltaromaticum]
MKQISVLIKPASSLCNIRCNYCFYANVSSLREVQSFGKMKKETTEKMISNIFVDLNDGDQLTLAFQGGEPTLAGLTYYENIVHLVSNQGKKIKVNYAIQTNGIIINDRWCCFFKENNFLVGLSIDGNPLYHDLNRLDPKGRGTFQRVLQTKKLFDKYDIEYNILCVLTNPLAKEAKKIFRFLKEEQLKYIQFIPCLDDLDATTKNSYVLTPKRFASFYRQFFNLWYSELEKGNYISVKLFDDILNLLVRKQATACGILGNCQIQYVIESDGSVYPCDFYVLDDYRMGYIQEQTLKELFEHDVSNKFVCEKKETKKQCEMCPFQQICHGGCKRMKDAMYVDKTGFCGYQNILKMFVPKIDEILELLQEVYE